MNDYYAGNTSLEEADRRRNELFDLIEKYSLAPWVERACGDIWQFCIVLKNGDKLAISACKNIYSCSDGIWLEVLVLNNDDVKYFPNEKYITSATSRNNYFVKYSEVMMFYELADT